MEIGKGIMISVTLHAISSPKQLRSVKMMPFQTAVTVWRRDEELASKVHVICTLRFHVANPQAESCILTALSMLQGEMLQKLCIATNTAQTVREEQIKHEIIMNCELTQAG